MASATASLSSPPPSPPSPPAARARAKTTSKIAQIARFIGRAGYRGRRFRSLVRAMRVEGSIAGREAAGAVVPCTLPRLMRVLILGGDGYLGWPTAMRLSQRGHEVSVVDNFSRRRW